MIQCLKFNSLREVWIIYIYTFACIITFVSWHIPGFSSIGRQLIEVCVLLSIDWSRWNKFKIFLVLLLLVSLLFARRMLAIWSIMAIVYQINELGIPLKKLATIGASILIIELFIQTEILLLGILENKGIFVPKVHRIVYDLGTGNSNRFGALILFFILCLYVVLKDSRRTLFVISSLIISYITYYITGSRTAFYAAIILNMVSIAIWRGWIKPWMRWYLSLVPALFFIATFWLAATMEDNAQVNRVASGRLYYVVMLTTEYTTKEWLIGAPVEVDAPLDSSYLDMITKGGIILASFFCIGYATTLIKYFKSIKTYIPFILALLASGLTETYFLDPNSVSIIFWCFILKPFIK